MNNNERTSKNSSVLSQFIAEFEEWIFGEFSQLLCKRAGGISDPSELTVMLLPWVDRLVGFGENGVLREIGTERAARLLSIVNHALDGLSAEYRRWGASHGSMILALSPIDDLLVYLSLAMSQTCEIRLGLIAGGK